MADQLLSTEDVAEVLGIPAKTLVNWRWAGKGPRSFRVGRYVKYRDSAVQAWIEQQELQNRRKSKRPA